MISKRPDFGPNRGNRGPISATSGPSRLERRFGPPKRGAAKGISAEIGAAADKLIHPHFLKKSGFLKNLATRPSFPSDPISGRIAVTEARFRRRPGRAGCGSASSPQNGAPPKGSAPKLAPRPTS